MIHSSASVRGARGPLTTVRSRCESEMSVVDENVGRISGRKQDNGAGLSLTGCDERWLLRKVEEKTRSRNGNATSASLFKRWRANRERGRGSDHTILAPRRKIDARENAPVPRDPTTQLVGPSPWETRLAISGRIGGSGLVHSVDCSWPHADRLVESGRSHQRCSVRAVLDPPRRRDRGTSP